MALLSLVNRMGHPIHFDYQRFHDLLLDAARRAFTDIQNEHPDEVFYTFALYTSGDHGSLLPSSNTEQGLDRRAKMYLEHYGKTYAGYSLGDMCLDLRDSPCDWEYHNPRQYIIYFKEINQLLEDRRQILTELFSSLATRSGFEEGHAATRPHRERFNQQCISVLKILDQEGIFGSGWRRDRVVINLLMGDQNERERFHFADLLNPPLAAEQYKCEVLAAHAIQQ